MKYEKFKKMANPESLCQYLFLLQVFFLKTIFCMDFQLACVKKSQSVSHVWATGAQEESITLAKFLKCEPHLCHSPTHPSWHYTLVSWDVLHCNFLHRHRRKVLKTYSDPLQYPPKNTRIFLSQWRNFVNFWVEAENS